MGWSAPAGFLVAAAMLAVFAVGYVEMARRLRSAGGFYTFVSAGLGRVLGLGTASMATTAYGVFTASLIGAFAYFSSTTIESWTEISIPVWALLVGALVVNLAFAYFEVRLTARVLGAFFVAELAGLLVFALIVLVHGGAEGLTAAPLNPLAILDNEGAIAVFGAAAPGIALYIGAFQLHDASRDAALLKLAIWSSLLGILGVIAAQALTSFAIVAYFRRDSGASRWRTLVAPLVGGGLMVFSSYLVVDNRETLAGAEDAPFVEAIPWTVVAAFAAGVTAALWRRARDAAGYRAVGQVVTEDAEPTP